MTNIAPANDTGDSARKTPAVVAIPLPPLNRMNTENMCPMTAKNPATYMIHKSGHAASRAMAGAKNTGRNPFNMSATSTPAAIREPRKRKVFDAPRFPLPCSRRSMLANTRPAM